MCYRRRIITFVQNHSVPSDIMQQTMLVLEVCGHCPIGSQNDIVVQQAKNVCATTMAVVLAACDSIKHSVALKMVSMANTEQITTPDLLICSIQLSISTTSH